MPKAGAPLQVFIYVTDVRDQDQASQPEPST